MKKRIFLLSFLICTVLLLASCSSDNYKLALNNISEYRKELYVGSNEQITASYICGEREIVYTMDGISTESTEFGVLTFFVNEELDGVPEYTLVIDNQTFSGNLEQNPFDGSYVADIEKCLSGNNISATISLGEFSSQVELKKVNTDWEINGEKALEITCKNMGKDFKSFMENGAFLGECYIKIVNDSSISNNEYYWYVNIIGTQGNSFSAIIDPHSGEILAKKSLNK